MDGSEYNLRHPRTRRRTLYAVKLENHVNCVCGQSSLIRRLGKIKKDCVKQSNATGQLGGIGQLRPQQVLRTCRLRMKDSRFLFVREGRNKD